MVAVGRYGCRLELPVGLIEEILGVGGVAVHVPLIRLLRGYDSVVGLGAKTLRGSQIRMPAANVALGSLSCADPGCCGSNAEEAA